MAKQYSFRELALRLVSNRGVRGCAKDGGNTAWAPLKVIVGGMQEPTPIGGDSSRESNILYYIVQTAIFATTVAFGAAVLIRGQPEHGTRPASVGAQTELAASATGRRNDA